GQVVLYGFVVLALSSGLLVAFACQERNVIPPWGWVGKGVSAIGRRSYTIYLVHFPLMLVVLETRFRMSGIREGWSSATAAAVALLSYLAALTVVTEACFRAL